MAISGVSSDNLNLTATTSYAAISNTANVRQAAQTNATGNATDFETILQNTLSANLQFDTSVSPDRYVSATETTASLSGNTPYPLSPVTDDQEAEVALVGGAVAGSESTNAFLQADGSQVFTSSRKEEPEIPYSDYAKSTT